MPHLIDLLDRESPDGSSGSGGLATRHFSTADLSKLMFAQLFVALHFKEWFVLDDVVSLLSEGSEGLVSTPTDDDAQADMQVMSRMDSLGSGVLSDGQGGQGQGANLALTDAGIRLFNRFLTKLRPEQSLILLTKKNLAAQNQYLNQDAGALKYMRIQDKTLVTQVVQPQIQHLSVGASSSANAIDFNLHKISDIVSPAA